MMVFQSESHVGQGLSSRTARQVASLGPLFPQSQARSQPIGVRTVGASSASSGTAPGWFPPRRSMLFQKRYYNGSKSGWVFRRHSVRRRAHYDEISLGHAALKLL